MCNWHLRRTKRTRVSLQRRRRHLHLSFIKDWLNGYNFLHNRVSHIDFLRLVTTPCLLGMRHQLHHLPPAQISVPSWAQGLSWEVNNWSPSQILHWDPLYFVLFFMFNVLLRRWSGVVVETSRRRSTSVPDVFLGSVLKLRLGRLLRLAWRIESNIYGPYSIYWVLREK